LFDAGVDFGNVPEVFVLLAGKSVKIKVGIFGGPVAAVLRQLMGFSSPLLNFFTTKP